MFIKTTTADLFFFFFTLFIDLFRQSCANVKITQCFVSKFKEIKIIYFKNAWMRSTFLTDFKFADQTLKKVLNMCKISKIVNLFLKKVKITRSLVWIYAFIMLLNRIDCALWMPSPNIYWIFLTKYDLLNVMKLMLCNCFHK